MLGSVDVLSVLLLSTTANGLVAWVLVWKYRARMLALMRRTASASPAADVSPKESRALPPAAPPERRAVRAAEARLTAWIVLVSAVVAFSGAAAWLTVQFPGRRPTPGTFAVYALVWAWPAFPALGILWRWSRGRVLAAVLGWAALCFPVILALQAEVRLGEAAAFIAAEVGILPFVLVLFLGPRTRAVAPWLLPLVAALVVASQAGGWVLYGLFERNPRLMYGVAMYTGVAPLLLLALGLPWLLAALPAWGLARLLAAAYRRRWFSDLLASFTGIWAFALLDKVATSIDAQGAPAFAVLLSLLWIPLAAPLLRRSKHRPPTFLVLRVFQQDAQVQALFDSVIDRFRLVGPTVLIAGTDLADRTVDVDHVFAYLGGRLPERFVASPSDVARRLDALQLGPDVDGRYRVEPLYCSDHAWRSVLKALVGRSDVVLMDLRGFQRTNEGCLFELGTLATTDRGLRVVVLTDERTDRAAAQAAIRGAPADRFAWVEVRGQDHTRVLEALFP